MSAFSKARVEDAEALLTLQQAYYAEDGYPFDEAHARTALVGLLSDPRSGLVWVARGAGEPVGYLVVTFGYSLEYGGRDAFIDELYIAPGHRGRGLGREAVRLAREACVAAGVRALHLEVEVGKDAALRIYRDAGFAGQGRHLLTLRLDT